jgi:hypothetical protein
MPFPPNSDGPFASILSRANRFYTHFAANFCEFDPVRGEFTFHQKTTPQMAMSMTEDDRGLIWSATYPECGLVSYDPRSGALNDYGPLNKENWLQYPRSIAADDAGWIYVGLGNTSAQIVAFDPNSRRATPLLAAAERFLGVPPLARDQNGKVYGQSFRKEGAVWLELYQGRRRNVAPPPALRPRPIIAGSQGLEHRQFPSGKRLATCDLVQRLLVVEDPKNHRTQQVRFEYSSEGAHVMALAAAPDGTICGGTAFPMRFFSFNPATDRWINRPAFGQLNTVARQGDRFFMGGYGEGFLLEWDPSRPWVDTVAHKPQCNPLWLTQCPPTINRPHALLAHPDGNTLVLAGTPGYGHTGGGLLFWDRATRQPTLIEHTALVPQHSTHSLLALSRGNLPGGKLLCGTTTNPGTGGEKKAKEAVLYILDMATKKIEWQEAVLPGVQTYTSLCAGPQGLVLGFADATRFFVFDPAKRRVVHQQDLSRSLGPVCTNQGPRNFILGPHGEILILFVRAIARLETEPGEAGPAVTSSSAAGRFTIRKLTATPVPVTAGGDILAGRIYFAGGSHVYSFQVPDEIPAR